MSVNIYNQNGQVYIDQSIPAGESSNKVANAKYVVDTVNNSVNPVNSSLNSFKSVVDGSFSTVNSNFTTFKTRVDNSLNTVYTNLSTYKGVLDASFGDLKDGDFVVGRATHLNISNSGNGSLPYQTANNTTTSLTIGNENTVLLSNGTVPSWTPQSNLNVGRANDASNCTNILGGSAGQLLYQSASNITSRVDVGTAGHILKSNNTGPPTWVNQRDLSVNYAYFANDISGGSAGQLLYQSGANTTERLTLGNNTEILQVDTPTNRPKWVSLNTLDVSGASRLTTARRINNVLFDGTRDISLNVLGASGENIGFFGLQGSTRQQVSLLNTISASITDISYNILLNDVSNVRSKLDTLINVLSSYNLINK